MTPSPAATYRLAPFWRVYAYLFLAISFILAFIIARLAWSVFGPQPLSQAFLLAAAAGLAGLGIFLFIQILRVRLSLSPAGIALQSIGYTVTAPWSAVAGLGVQPGCSGLSLTDPTVTVEPWLAVLMALGRPAFILNALTGRYRRYPDLMRAARCLPIQSFASPWEGSRLAADLARHIPPADPIP